MHLSLVRNFAIATLLAGGLAVALAGAALLGELSWSDGLTRYPAADRLGATHFGLDTLAKGYVSQNSAYQTADRLPTVLGWYARSFGLREPEGAMGSCLTLTREESHWPFQHALAVTVCSQPGGTLVFVHRSLAVRR